MLADLVHQENWCISGTAIFFWQSGTASEQHGVGIALFWQAAVENGVNNSGSTFKGIQRQQTSPNKGRTGIAKEDNSVFLRTGPVNPMNEVTSGSSTRKWGDLDGGWRSLTKKAEQKTSILPLQCYFFLLIRLVYLDHGQTELHMKTSYK